MWKVAFIASAALLSVALAGAAVPSSRTHITFVSVQRIAAQSSIGQTSAKRLEAARQEKTRAVAAKQQHLESVRLEIARNGGVLYRSKREELQKQEDQEKVELEKLKESAQSELQALQREIQGVFQADLKTVLVELAAQRDADIVINADTAVVWAKTGFDLTDDAIKRMDALDAGRKAGSSSKP
jgi:Skp family chaperone for outer membrane proteins